jgi:colicin import membrane protein
MVEFLRNHWAYLIAALVLHGLFAGVFGLTMLSFERRPPPAQLAIEAVVVDQSVLDRAARQQQREREQARERVLERERLQAQEQEQERQRREQEEASRRDAEQRAEQERQVELERREEEEQRRQLEEQQLRERREAERKREAEAERQRQQDAERKRVEEIKRRQKEEAERRKAQDEARAQQAREAELRNQLAEEEGRLQAENAGLLNQYIAMIQQRIVRNWNRPPSAKPGLECQVRVTQTPGGAVLSAQVGSCNGDAAVRQSIEAAVVRSSPLPPPPDPRLFERTLVLIFKPVD